MSLRVWSELVESRQVDELRQKKKTPLALQNYGTHHKLPPFSCVS